MNEESRAIIQVDIGVINGRPKSDKEKYWVCVYAPSIGHAYQIGKFSNLRDARRCRGRAMQTLSDGAGKEVVQQTLYRLWMACDGK